MKERSLMKIRWIGRSAGRCQRNGCAATIYSEVIAATQLDPPRPP
jgi:hypothetical protein